MRRSLVALVATSAITLGAYASFANDGPKSLLDKATSGTYSIDPTHTNVLFSLSHLGFSNYYGRFDTIAGNLVFDAKDPEKSKLDVTIDVASIDTNNEKLQGELKGPQWFDAAKFPTATFTSTSIEKLSPTSGKVTGNLTLHGVTKPVTLDVTLNGAGSNPIMKVEELGFSAKTTISRSDFGVSQYVPMVGDNVTLIIESELHLKK